LNEVFNSSTVALNFKNALHCHKYFNIGGIKCYDIESERMIAVIA